MAIAVVLSCYMTVLVIVKKFDKEDAKNVSVKPDFAHERCFNGACSPVKPFHSHDLIVNSPLRLLYIFFVNKLRQFADISR